MDSKIFIIVKCNDEMEITMTNDYYEKVKSYCNEHQILVSNFVKTKLEGFNYKLSLFYKLKSFK